MTYQILDGKKLADEILLKLKEKINKEKIIAKLSVIIVGNNPSSELYVRLKGKKCKEIGILFELIRFNENSSEKEIKNKIEEFNNDKEVTGILVQLPLPKKFDTLAIVDVITPLKDVDCLTTRNRKKLLKGDETISPCTPKGIIQLLKQNQVSVSNKNIVLVGHGSLVGKPLSIMLNNRKIEHRVCDEYVKDLKKETLKADILISATGVPHLIKKDYVKNGVIVVDAGTAKLKDRIVGDVDFDRVSEKTAYITPSRGGIGPLTIAILLDNILMAHKLQNKTTKNKIRKRIALFVSNDYIWAFPTWVKTIPELIKHHDVVGIYLFPNKLVKMSGLQMYLWHLKVFGTYNFFLFGLHFVKTRFMQLISPIKTWKRLANRYNIELNVGKTSNSKEVCDWVKKKDIDIIFIMVDHILKEEIINSPNVGIINKHSSILPSCRGIYPFFWSKLSDSPTGITFHKVDVGVDTGEHLIQIKYPFKEDNKISMLRFYVDVSHLYPVLAPLAVEQLITKKNCKPIANVKSSYHGLPTRIDFKEYKSKGYKIAKFRDLFYKPDIIGQSTVEFLRNKIK